MVRLSQPRNQIEPQQNQEELVCQQKEVHSIEYYESLVNENLRMILNRESGVDKVTTWKFVKESKGIKLSQGAVEGSSWMPLKATTTINSTASKVSEYINDPSRLPVFDKMVASSEIIEQIDTKSNTSIRHIKAKAIFPTSAREFVVVTTLQQQDGGSFVIATRSVTDGRVPEGNGFVRAKAIISGYIIKPLDSNTCEVTVVCHVDLGGYVPSTVINFLGTSAPINLLDSIRNLCSKL